MDSTFKQELQTLLNKHSRENVSNTPDFILANYMLRSLEAYEEAIGTREQWYGVRVKPGELSMDLGFKIDLTKQAE